MCHVNSPTSLTVESTQGKKLFVFDRVFAPETDQEGIWEYLNESVNSFVQGYNVSILAYGQSGAGKSFTMGTSGPAEQGNPRIMGKRGQCCCYDGILIWNRGCASRSCRALREAVWPLYQIWSPISEPLLNDQRFEHAVKESG
jgi:hypothetical protein